MNRITRTIALVLATSAALALPAAHACEDMDIERFVAMRDADKDGMVSEAEVMKHVERMFLKHDTGRRASSTRPGSRNTPRTG